MRTSSVRVVILISGLPSLSFSCATPKVNIVKTAVMVAMQESSLRISTCLSLTRKKKRRDQQHESKRGEHTTGTPFFDPTDGGHRIPKSLLAPPTFHWDRRFGLKSRTTTAEIAPPAGLRIMATNLLKLGAMDETVQAS